MLRETALGVALDATDSNPALTLERSTRRLFDDEQLFFRTWLCEPVTIGAIMPTRAPLALAMSGTALQAAAARAGRKCIVELGGGTGPLTGALARYAPDPSAIVVVERNPVFHRVLVSKFPRLQVILGDAEYLVATLGDRQIGTVAAVVSSLPRVGWSLERQRRILQQCFELLGDGGVFLEFSYGPFSPVPRALIRELGLTAARVRRVWGNFPPATIWGYRLRA